MVLYFFRCRVLFISQRSQQSEERKGILPLRSDCDKPKATKQSKPAYLVHTWDQVRVYSSKRATHVIDLIPSNPPLCCSFFASKSRPHRRPRRSVSRRLFVSTYSLRLSLVFLVTPCFQSPLPPLSPFRFLVHVTLGKPKPTKQAAVSWTPEASWRTKSRVDYDWGVFSPEVGVDRFGTSPYLVPNGNASTVEDSSSSPSMSSPELPSWNASSPLFPADYFTARFTGFGKMWTCSRQNKCKLFFLFFADDTLFLSSILLLWRQTTTKAHGGVWLRLLSLVTTCPSTVYNLVRKIML